MDTKANWLQTRFLRLSRLRKQLMFVLWTLGGFRAWLHFRRYPPVFIVGAPRSGTTLLFQILSMQARVTPVFEPNKLWVLALGPHEDDTYRARVTVLGKLRLLWLYYSLLEDNCPILLSKDPKDSLRVCLLHDVFPTARFVHIIRDGRDVVASVTRIWHGDSFRVDVERSELRALQGAENTIRRFRPKLAVSVYHREDDLITIPEYVASLGLNYQLFLDHFSIHGEETVLFACPSST